MIDEKINKSLKELEQTLKSIESARKQVEKTVNAFDGLNSTTAEYVSNLGIITSKVQELVEAIGLDYTQNVKAFEKDRETIINASTAATEKLSNSTDEFKDSLLEIKKKLKYSLIINSVLLIAISTILFLLFK